MTPNHELIAAAVQALATPAPTADNPDAALIAACEQFIELEWQRLRTMYGPTAIEDDNERAPITRGIGDKQDALWNAIQQPCPTTLAGFRARARAACIWAPDRYDAPDDLHDMMVQANIIDLAGQEWLDEINAFMGRAP